MSYTITIPKGKGGANMVPVLTQANTFDTLAEKLAAVSVGTYEPQVVGSGPLQNQATSYILWDLFEQDLLSRDAAMGLNYALYGAPDTALIPDWMGPLLLSTPITAPIGTLLVLKMLATGKTVQDLAGTDKTLAQMLDEVAAIDPAAADELAQVIAYNQGAYDSDYVANMAQAFGKGAWKGAMIAVKEPIKAAAAAVGAGLGALGEGLAQGLGLGGVAVLAAAALGWYGYKRKWFSK